MADDELQAIRAKRMAEMRAAQGGAASASGGLPAGMVAGAGGQGQNAAEEAEKKSQMDEMRRNMLFQILDNDARERLARIKIVKSDKARAVEDLLIRMAQSGQIRQKVNETTLIGLLEQINEANQKETKIVYNRRREDDSDEEDWGL
ncbi:PDCD5-related protein [Fimicolochytrium jonesii]|uniref:PDCD5-related protein n=1 Tax=Fimicolochytrium jonesii TaxID=1396493 RepID=UPI0022FEC63D|nr:PDCD5-related protein [Fimicolochytrium jonesii]KAI8822071.1 PDCD5-related protein [Fimicolochytrium jonesii]